MLDSCVKLSDSNPDAALPIAEEVHSRKDEITDPEFELRMYTELAMITNSIGMHAQALAYCQAGKRALELSQSAEKIGNYHLVYGHVLSHLKKYEEALLEYSIALKQFEALDDSSGRSYVYSGMGIVYYDLGQPQRALENYLKSDSLWASDDLALHADLYNNIGAVCVEFDQYDQGRWYYNKALATYEDLGWMNSVSMIHFNLGELLMREGVYDESKQEYMESLRIGKEIGSLEEVKWAYYGLYELEKQLGTEAEALNCHEKFYRYADSLQQMLNLKEVMQLSEVYEQERIKRENLELEADNTLLQLERNRTQKQRAFLWAGFIILLLLVVGGAFVIVRIRRYNNQLILQRQEIMAKNATIDEALSEKELLLKEIHHRVKNNLQIISSLLNLQKHQVGPDAVAAFEESQNRIQAIALIHKKLYQSKNIDRVNFGTYLMELINHQQHLYHSGAGVVKYNVETHGIELGLDSAVPLGLIVAELIANSFKHAFVGVDSKQIALELERDGNYLHMTVSDNGVGLPDNFNQGELDSLGMDIILALVEQLDGTIQFDSNKGEGTSCTITFKEA